MIDIKAILETGEKLTVEAKLAQGGLPNSIWETYSAFANSYGGTILLGVDENKKTKELSVTGIDNPQKLISDFWNIVNNPNKINVNILLDEHVYEMDYDNKKIVVIEVPRADRSDKPIYINNDLFSGTYRRNADGDYRCSKDTVLAMLRDNSAESADSKVLEKCPMEYLNEDSIRSYRTAFANLRDGHVWTKLSNDEFLTKIAAARKGEDGKLHPTLAGLIFFGDFTYITDYLPNFFLDYREQKGGKNRWTDRVCSGDGDWSGNIFDFYFKIIHKLTADVEKPFQLDENSLRIDQTKVHDALREALANALIHADYYGRRGIVIEKDFKTIKISNPGTFRINIAEAIDGGISDARNAKIFNMFALVKVGERSGMGLCDLYETWEQYGYVQPRIEETLDPDRVSITLKLEGNNSSSVGNDGNRVGNNVGNNGKNVGNDDGDVLEIEDMNAFLEGFLTKTEFIIYSIIKENPKISAAKIAKDVNISKRSVERSIAVLKEKGYIAREGSTRGKWIILK